MEYEFYITYDNDDFTESFSEYLNGTVVDVVKFVSKLRCEGFTDICVTCPRDIDYREVDMAIYPCGATATW